MNPTRVRLGCGLFMFLSMGGMYWYAQRASERRVAQATAEYERPGMPIDEVLPAGLPDPRELESRLQREAANDPEKALGEARRLLSGDGGPDYVGVGKAVLPKALAELARRRLEARAYEDAEAALSELASLDGTGPQVAELRKSFDAAGGERLWRQVSKGEWSAADELAKKLLASAHPADGRGSEALRLLGEHHASEFQRLEAIHDSSAGGHLEIAAALTARLQDSKLMEIGRGFGPTLEDRARFFVAAGKPVVVAALYEVALAQLTFPNRTGPAMDRAVSRRAELEDLHASAQFALLKQLAREGHDWVPARRGVELASKVRNHAAERGRDDRRRKRTDRLDEWSDRLREATQASVQLRLSEARAQAEAGDADAALGTLESIWKNQGFELVDSRVADPDWRGWSELPDETRKLIDAERLNDPETWRRRLAQYVYEGRWRPDLPELMAVGALDRELRTRFGLSLIDLPAREERERGQDLLRGVLRSDPGVASTQKVTRTLQEKLRSPDRQLEFAVLLDLTAFYVAELAAPGREDPFYAELEKLLVKAVQQHQANPTLERLFLLTLIADLYPDEPSGQEARREAMDKVFELIGRAHAEEFERHLPVPSGLSGRSVNALDNATRYHLLVFFDGPERFFVRVPPVRRGTIVLRDGRYKMAAIVTAEQVIPSRGELEWKSTFVDSKYKIVHTGGTRKWEESAHVGGHYLLLRAPPGESFAVDPKTGVASAR